jgi:ribosome-associated protein
MDELQRPSKTQRKQAMHDLQALGARLAELKEAQLASIGLDERLLEAIREARRIRSHEARRRQLQFVGKLMREVDAEPIRAWFAALDGASAAATAAHHRVERWRERLLGDDAALTEFARECPGADLQPLRACVREARKERLAGKPPRHFRELFQLVRAALAPREPAVDERAHG